MQIINPQVEYWNQGNTEQSIKEHVSKCSQTAYRSVPKTGDAAVKFYNALVSSGHVSCLRHESVYYIIPFDKVDFNGLNRVLDFMKGENPFIEIKMSDDCKVIYIATNGNFILDHKEVFDTLSGFRVTGDEFNTDAIGHSMMRYTLYCTTSIDITREYNRRSPNNITEESTIYCNYSKDKFGGEIMIGGSKAFEPVDNSMFNSVVNSVLNGESLERYTDDVIYNTAFNFAEKMYMELTSRGVKSEAARKTLPLATKSGVAYTYSVKEWSHILRLRYLNTTGRDHFDANNLGRLIYEQFQKLGYTLNEQGELV